MQLRRNFTHTSSWQRWVWEFPIHAVHFNLVYNLFIAMTWFNCKWNAGVITDKEIIPISRLNFGRTPLETSSGIHTLGRYECTGKVAIVGMPTSCEDLWRIGHSLSGLYLVLEGEIVKNVYCNFTKLSSEAGTVDTKWTRFFNLSK